MTARESKYQVEIVKFSPFLLLTDRPHKIYEEDEFLQDDDGNDDEDDPLEDLNSEECNAIIDSVLQESPSEQATPCLNGLQNRRDMFAKKDDKGG